MYISHLFSQVQTKIDAGSLGIPVVKDPNSVINGILNTAYMWAGILCVIVIVIAGYYYVTSGGNSSHTKRAREAIIGAIVGLIIILMAFIITQFVIGRF